MRLLSSVTGGTPPGSTFTVTLPSRLSSELEILSGCNLIGKHVAVASATGLMHTDLFSLHRKILDVLGILLFGKMERPTKLLGLLLLRPWLHNKKLVPTVYYPDLERVDLHGRSLLQVGDTFTFWV